MKRTQTESGPQSGASSAAGFTRRSGRMGRRELLSAGAAAGGLLATAAGASRALAADAPLPVPPQMKIPGRTFSGYGQPAKAEETVQRFLTKPYGDVAGGSGNSQTPIQALNGTITPSGLHFERHHNGVPEIDPAQHRFVIHGLVKRPLAFTVADLLRYPQVSRIHFIECSGNGNRGFLPEPVQAPAGVLRGMISNSEWTGIPLSVLLEEAGVETQGKWLLAEGADSAAMSRSVPMVKALDDAMIGLYQNGERLRPEQGYPMRLLLPGFEGNTNVKWLRRIQVIDSPMYTKDETSKYTDLMPDGKAKQFTLELGVNSIITRPSFGMKLERGFHEISGIAWSGAGRIAKVEVSTDGGNSWRVAALQGESHPKAVARFRLPWEWNGADATLQSRSTDEKGRVQPTRKALVALYSPANPYHNHCIHTWHVQPDGSIRHVYA
jgi:sulfane dehydrogenase subunit SoxC